MAFRFDIQSYGPGALAFDVQTYAGGQNTVQNAFIDLYVVPNAVQAYTPAPVGTVQAGAAALAITAASAQAAGGAQGGAAGVVITAAASQAFGSMQPAAASLSLVANAGQDYMSGTPIIATTQQGAARLSLIPNAVQTVAFNPNLVIAKLKSTWNGKLITEKAIATEGSTAFLGITYLDAAGALVLPQALTMRIDCLSTFIPILAEVAIDPTELIVLDGAATELVHQGHLRERRRVTIKANYGLGREYNAEFDYDVQNLSALQ